MKKIFMLPLLVVVLLVTGCKEEPTIPYISLQNLQIVESKTLDKKFLPNPLAPEEDAERCCCIYKRPDIKSPKLRDYWIGEGDVAWEGDRDDNDPENSMWTLYNFERGILVEEIDNFYKVLIDCYYGDSKVGYVLKSEVSVVQTVPLTIHDVPTVEFGDYQGLLFDCEQSYDYGDYYFKMGVLEDGVCVYCYSMYSDHGIGSLTQLSNKEYEYFVSKMLKKGFDEVVKIKYKSYGTDYDSIYVEREKLLEYSKEPKKWTKETAQEIAERK